ncbi:MAG: hypothetical protein HY348_03035 [Nitrospira defluvii]|nr:hypothetical protein [Nitrospira defluvii]
MTNSKTVSVVVSLAIVLSGCTTTLIHDELKRTVATERHCTGSEWADNSSVAVLPVPVVAFFVPHFDLNKVSSEPYLSRCGDSTRVVNRDVSVNRGACIPAGLTRIVTLGIWQWCPSHVSWTADILPEGPKPTGALRDASSGGRSL